ncbi:hypothetical protein VP01_3267g1 [Puccinia sorghi]|uniref:Uncharacterized protein n=1 Tax=Puccinia sorghi TaxID=27349 RepID=A0A0L6UXZ7_9BASI|nr:hypothetical protein VP01_3267g1 [Puccinia sorghi]
MLLKSTGYSTKHLLIHFDTRHSTIEILTFHGHNSFFLCSISLQHKPNPWMPLSTLHPHLYFHLSLLLCFNSLLSFSLIFKLVHSFCIYKLLYFPHSFLFSSPLPCWLLFLNLVIFNIDLSYLAPHLQTSPCVLRPAKSPSSTLEQPFPSSSRAKQLASELASSRLPTIVSTQIFHCCSSLSCPTKFLEVLMFYCLKFIFFGRFDTRPTHFGSATHRTLQRWSRWVAEPIFKFCFINFFGGQIVKNLITIISVHTLFRVRNSMVRLISPKRKYFNIIGNTPGFLNVFFSDCKAFNLIKSCEKDETLVFYNVEIVGKNFKLTNIHCFEIRKKKSESQYKNILSSNLNLTCGPHFHTSNGFCNPPRPATSSESRVKTPIIIVCYATYPFCILDVCCVVVVHCEAGGGRMLSNSVATKLLFGGCPSKPLPGGKVYSVDEGLDCVGGLWKQGLLEMLLGAKDSAKKNLLNCLQLSCRNFQEASVFNPTILPNDCAKNSAWANMWSLTESLAGACFMSTACS